MQVISSKDNEIVKSIKKLKDKKYRDLSKEFIVEGIKLVEEAIQENAEIKKIIICEDCINNGLINKNLMYEIAKNDCIYVTEKVFQSLSDVTNPQGILAVIGQNTIEEIKYNDDIILVLDGIQDPGNLGTILRTLDSTNLKQVIITNKTADPYNPKVVRSTMGAIYRVNVIQTDDLVKTLKDIKKHKYQIASTSLQTKETIYDINYKKIAIVIGNEANGVSKEVLDISDEKIKIPMLGKTESLNAGVATGIVLYEYVRRKVKGL